MNRRQFLTIATAVTAVGLTRLATPPLAAAKGIGISPNVRQVLYRGTNDGKLHESTDGGKTWQQVANFGAHCAVTKITTQRNGAVSVTLTCAHNTFDLHSQNARLWRTA